MARNLQKNEMIKEEKKGCVILTHKQWWIFEAIFERQIKYHLSGEKKHGKQCKDYTLSNLIVSNI